MGSSLKRIALVTEETEYTLDITRAFEQTFRSGRGLLGNFSIDEKGNANTGFVPAEIN